LSPAGPLAIVCGGGLLPLQAARAARAGGREVFLIGLASWAEHEIEAFDHVWVKLGEFGRVTRLLREKGIVELAMLGTVSRPDFSDVKLDWGAVKRAGAIARLFRGGDDGLLKGIARIFESEGFRFVGIADFAPELLSPQGLFVGPKPDAEAEADIAFGARLLAALSPFDVGQGAVVARQRVVAIEAAEGTDAMLKRVADLRASGRVRFKGRAGVFVKAAKRGQDFRFDLPTVGPATIEAATRAELSGIALSAGETLILERDSFVAAAERAGLFVIGFAP
jgi:UDP-2,3-diacylglucosamine hydrolase